MKNDNTCKMKGCVSKLLLSAIPVFIFIVVADFLVNGLWLKDIYLQTANLWRPEEEMKHLFPWVFAYQAALAIIFTALYCRHQGIASPSEGGKKPCPRMHALCFGFTIGMLLAVMHAAAYIWMPIPIELAVKWAIAGLLEGIGIGIVLSFTCRK
jgi:hypothetical protein